MNNGNVEVRKPRQKFYVAPYYADPDNSASVFERGRLNEFGERYCVEAGLTYEQARRLARRLNGDA